LNNDVESTAFDRTEILELRLGVIKKVLYQGKILDKPRHRNLFLDMEENIHIHYRDLRIELSRAEFEEIAAIFVKQAQELQAIILEKNYQDGKLPNANQEDVRIWTESRLQQEVKYHPQRFALEECGDGYHLHYRNYKILIDPDDFKHIVDLFKNVDLDEPYASSYDEVVDLLAANDVDFILDAGNIPGSVLALMVAQHHIPKVKDTFKYIGFSEEIVGVERHYQGSILKVVVKADKQRSALDYRRIRSYSSPVRLVDYLSRHSATINPNELNRIKCQVLDVYFALKKGQKLTIETDPQLWLYTPAGAGQVIFPYNAVSSDKTSADKLYSIWSNLLARLQLGFIKPSKTSFPAAVQEPLRQQIDELMRREAAAFAAVDKIYVMGSVNRKELGRYEAPFVHGKMAKLGSDVDILIEIDPEREGDIPPSWHFINPEASNHCAVYHVAEIPLPDGAGDWPTLHPNMDFIQHLIDAYVFFPSRGFHEEKEAFLRKFGAKLFYDRARDGTFYRNEEEERIATRLKQIHAFPNVVVEKMKVSTENAIFKVFVDNTPYILKLFKVAGNYSSSRIVEHTDYEENLVRQLKQRGIATAGIVHAPAAMDTTIEGFPALLFERIPGQVQQRPEYPLDKISAALAAIHQVQLEQPLTLDSPFHYEDACMIWLPTFHTYLQDAPSYSADIAQAFARLAPLADNCHPGENRGFLFARSPSLHSHGDVTPKNVISVEQGDTCFFDFNNAFYGSRIIDVIDGAFEFSLAEKYIDLADFSRFDAFIAEYTAHNPLLPEEQADLTRWIELIGIIKFTKEIRVLLQRPKENLRRRRALAIAEFVLSRVANAKS